MLINFYIFHHFLLDKYLDTYYIKCDFNAPSLPCQTR